MSDHGRLAEVMRLNAEAIERGEHMAAELRKSAERAREVVAHAHEALDRIVAERDAYKADLEVLAEAAACYVANDGSRGEFHALSLSAASDALDEALARARSVLAGVVSTREKDK